MYEKQVQSAIDAIAAQNEGFFAKTVDRDILLGNADHVLKNLDRDVARIKTEGAVLFSSVVSGGNAESAGHQLASAFDQWRNDPPSTVALMLVAAEKLGVDVDSPNFKAALMTGLAAEVKHDNAYHNTSHFREVTAVMTRLINANNELAATGAIGTVLLDSDDISKCLACAASHDLMHDGKGNAPTGPASHIQYRLENMAIDAAEPFLKLAGMAQSDIDDISVMIRITDISAKPGQPSPHKILRQIYAQEFDGVVPEKPYAIPAELAALKTNPKLLDMASMMSDSDLGPSAATDYIFSRKMTGLVAAETPALKDSDATLLGFMNYVVENTFTSAAGKATAQASLKAIFNEASSRVEAEKKLAAEGPKTDAPKTDAPTAPKR